MKRKFIILIGTTSVILSLVSQPAFAVWTGFVNLQPGAIVTSDPSCASLGTTQVICAAKGTDSNLYANRFNGSSWTGFVNLQPGAIVTSDPSCASLGTTQVICAAKGTDSNLYANRFNGSSWTGFVNLQPGAIVTS
ncbi:MAG: hypothetical protein V7K97_02720, partial [Nostoc sp.]